MKPKEIVIIAARRTPIGAFLGQFSGTLAHEPGAAAINAAVSDSRLEADEVDELIMGCALPAGLGQAPARQAALNAGLSISVPCTTINKVCGSGMKSVMQGADAIAAGSANIVVAGGMESMSRAPYLALNTRQGARFGHTELLDHMLFDGLQNASDGQAMGVFAEQCATHFGFSREQLDAFTVESVNRAMAAVSNGAFANELTTVNIKTRHGEEEITTDETPARCKPDKIPGLKPAFQKNGVITAANSSSISDGAAALVLMSADEAIARNILPLARIVAHTSHAMSPEEFTLAPIHAMTKLYQKCHWRDNDVDLYEINEAFAAVTMGTMHELKIDHAKVNVNGGACALGHPIGASGTRIIVTLLHALRARGQQRGIASLCIGGGEATAIAIEVTN